jgi:VIT1/CCC1 family predicted Fe2+/Mn2+ transporter
MPAGWRADVWGCCQRCSCGCGAPGRRAGTGRRIDRHAAGEYVSVSSQVDVERADLAREKVELAANPDAELTELATIYRKRGLSDDLANRRTSVARRRSIAGSYA